LPVHLGDQAFVALLRGELEQLDRVRDFLREPGRELYFLDETGALPQDRLGLVLVVPKTGLTRDLI
jgi:hypothetical protein